MLKINRKLEYGLEALLFLSAAGSRPISTREMAETCQVPEAMLSKILQSLKARGLVTAVHGNRGGYRLERPLSQIPLGALVSAVEEKPARRARGSAALKRLGEKLGEFLDTTTLESLKAAVTAGG